MQAFITEGPCGYYPERTTRNHQLCDARHELTRAQITRILNKGYRRFGVDYYRPYCRGCQECTPYRVLVNSFTLGRSFRRTLKRNDNAKVMWAAPKPTQEKFELYLRYQFGRHKELEQESELQLRKELAVAMIRQMYMNPADSLELVIRENDRVIGFATFDVTDDSLSAVYSVFDPELAERSLGTLNILLGIQKTRELGLPYLNLGLYLDGHEKMAYKAKFFPAEIYRDYAWRPIASRITRHT